MRPWRRKWELCTEGDGGDEVVQAGSFQGIHQMDEIVGCAIDFHW